MHYSVTLNKVTQNVTKCQSFGRIFAVFIEKSKKICLTGEKKVKEYVND